MSNFGFGYNEKEWHAWQSHFHMARAKLEWVKHHIDQLNIQAAAYLGERLKLHIGYDYRGDQLLKVKYHGEMPYSFGLMIGDIANNLRACLDYIIWELVAPNNPKRPNNICFPFPKKFEGLEREIKDGLEHLAGPHAERIIREAKPYPGGDDELYGLHRLTRLDKHRIITLVSDYVRVHALKGQEGNPFKPRVEFNNLRMGHGPNLMRDIHISGMQGLEIRRDGSVDQNQFDVTFHIVFEERMPLAGLSVLPTMIGLVKKVEGLLAQFDAAYPSRFLPNDYQP
jgi:hypothetical protein